MAQKHAMENARRAQEAKIKEQKKVQKQLEFEAENARKAR